MPPEKLLTTGNAAKLYCLQAIARIAAQHSGPLRLVDFGCGNAVHVAELLRRHPNIHYRGWDPSPGAVKAARVNLTNLNAEIHCDLPDSLRLRDKADVIVSFSVLEHVVNRSAYLSAVKKNLAHNGRVFMNYDAGHFYPPPTRLLGKTMRALLDVTLLRKIRNARARLGDKRAEFQAFVEEDAFKKCVDQGGLRIAEEKFFNTPLKAVYRIIAERSRGEYMRRWLEFELWLNDQEIEYGDDLASIFGTRNFVLEHA